MSTLGPGHRPVGLVDPDRECGRAMALALGPGTRSSAAPLGRLPLQMSRMAGLTTAWCRIDRQLAVTDSAGELI